MALIHRGVLRLAAGLVPAPQRREWLAEWTAELIYLERGGGRTLPTDYCSGAFRDALCLRAQAREPGSFAGERLWMASPYWCLTLLLAQATFAAAVMWASPAVRACVWDDPLQSHALIAAAAMLLCPLAPGTYAFPVGGVRTWCFMAAKSAMVTVIVFFASFDIVPVISRAPMQPQLAFVMYVLAYRWAINDQRQRCPVCLRVLTDPVRIGHSASTLLEWYGAEFVCSKGHGVLHEPERLANSYCLRRWVNLDASWRELFR